MMLESFAYVRPGSVAEALKQLEQTGARAHAGGTDLLGCLRDGAMSARTVVSLGRVDELRGITQTPDQGLRIGALTTIAEIAASEVVRERFRGLAQAASLVASPQLRNQGTIGGNLCQRPRCWYFRGDYACTRKGGDTCFAMDGGNQYHAIFGGSACWIVHPSDTAPALVALGASVRLVGPTGARVVPVEKFFVLPEEDVTKENVLGPGELLLEVLVPAAAPGTKTSYRKIRARGSWDFAMAGLALAVAVNPDRKVTAARVVFSGVAPVPWRVPAVEQAIIGQRLDAKTIAKAATAAIAGARPLSENAYKVDLVKGLVEEGLAGIQ